jgi:sugar phosphate isomerase/epimerase
VDLPACVTANGFVPETAASLLAMESQAIVVAGSSFKLVGHDAAARAELLTFSQWADSWQIPYIRVFGGGTWGKPLTDSDYQQAADAVTWWNKEREARKWKVEILLETHDAFSASAPCLEVIRRLDVPLSIIWDTHHTWRLGGEKPVESWKQLSRHVRHVHFKDSVNKPSARHPYTYVLPGTGEMPIAETLQVLQQHAFKGCVSLEWEKLWHPYLPSLRDALLHMENQPWFSEAVGRTK